MDSNLFSKFSGLLSYTLLARQESQAKVVCAFVCRLAVIPLLACIIKLVISDLMYSCARERGLLPFPFSPSFISSSLAGCPSGFSPKLARPTDVRDARRRNMVQLSYCWLGSRSGTVSGASMLLCSLFFVLWPSAHFVCQLIVSSARLLQDLDANQRAGRARPDATRSEPKRGHQRYCWLCKQTNAAGPM